MKPQTHVFNSANRAAKFTVTEHPDGVLLKCSIVRFGKRNKKEAKDFNKWLGEIIHNAFMTTPATGIRRHGKNSWLLLK